MFATSDYKNRTVLSDPDHSFQDLLRAVWDFVIEVASSSEAGVHPLALRQVATTCLSGFDFNHS